MKLIDSISCHGMRFLPSATKLRQGDVFTSVCHSVHGMGLCPEGSLTRGSLSRGVSVQGGLCPGGLCPGGGGGRWGVGVHGGLSGRPPPSTITCGWYVSYWNAFLWWIVTDQLIVWATLPTIQTVLVSLSSEHLNTCPFARDRWILLSDKWIFHLLPPTVMSSKIKIRQDL